MKNMETTQTSNSVVVIVTAVVGLGILGSGYLYFNNQNKQVQEAAKSSSLTSEAMMKKEEDSKMKSEAAMKSEEAMKKEEVMKKDEAMKSGESMSSESAMSKSSEVMVKSGSYTDYSKALLTNATNGKVVLFFKANWCPTCISLDKDITSKSEKIPAGTTILKLDYDNSTDLKKQYGVTQQHTLVQVDSNGTLIKKTVGLPSLESINTFLN